LETCYDIKDHDFCSFLLRYFGLIARARFEGSIKSYGNGLSSQPMIFLLVIGLPMIKSINAIKFPSCIVISLHKEQNHTNTIIIICSWNSMIPQYAKKKSNVFISRGKF
jgi:hypothetical protein